MFKECLPVVVCHVVVDGLTVVTGTLDVPGGMDDTCEGPDELGCLQKFTKKINQTLHILSYSIVWIAHYNTIQTINDPEKQAF